MKSGNDQPRHIGRDKGEPSSSERQSGDDREESLGAGRQSTKIEALCKECGQPFIKYTYSRLSRCEACRKAGEKPLQGSNK